MSTNLAGLQVAKGVRLAIVQADALDEVGGNVEGSGGVVLLGCVLQGVHAVVMLYHVRHAPLGLLLWGHLHISYA